MTTEPFTDVDYHVKNRSGCRHFKTLKAAQDYIDERAELPSADRFYVIDRVTTERVASYNLDAD